MTSRISRRTGRAQTVLAAVPEYRERGWHPFPILEKGQKWPPAEGITGWDGADPTDQDYKQWEHDDAWGNVALVLEDGYVGVDLDLYRHWPECQMCAEAVKGMGPRQARETAIKLHGYDPLPPTWHSTPRHDGSGIFLFRVPPGTVLVGKWELGDIIQHFHRYVMCPPSTHPDTGETYRGLDDDDAEMAIPDVGKLPDLPDSWLGRLDCKGPDGSTHIDVSEWMDTLPDGEMDGSVLGCLTAALDELRAEDCKKHPAMLRVTGQLVQLGADRHPGVREAIDTYIEEFRALADDRSRDATAELYRAITGAIRKYGKPVDWYEEKRAKLKSREQRENDFWSARPNLIIIRDVARSRLLSEWAVLGCCLVNAIMTADYRVCLPPITTRVGVLNLLLGVVGETNEGKGGAMDTANELVPVPEDTGRWGVGSGEGIAKGFQDKNGDWVTHRLILDITEVETLCKIAERGASIIMPEIRKTFSGEGLGQLNSDEKKRHNIPARSYLFGLVTGIQRGKAEALFNDDGGGTAPRFLMVPAEIADDLDPYAESLPADPLTLKPMKKPLAAIDGPNAAGLAAVNWPRPMSVSEDIRVEIRVARVEKTAPPHWMLVRLKVAAALSILTSDTPDQITDDDWALAGEIMKKSDEVRESITAYQAKMAADRDKMIGRSACRRAEATEGYHIERVAKVMVNRAKKLAAEGKPCTKRDLDRAVQAKDRDYKDDGRHLAVEKGWLVGDDDGKYSAA